MKLYFEEYDYPDGLLYENLGNHVALSCLQNGRAKIPYVGYFFNSVINDTVFILPKVFISENRQAFNRYNPEEIIDLSPDDNPLKENTDDEVVFELSAWLYRAISHFLERKQQSAISSSISIQNIRPMGEKRSKTIIEIILSLREFQKKHHNLFTYISLVKSSGNNKVHWTKTISQVQPLFRGATPYYLEFRNKNKVINFDEELIVLFYSVLNHISQTYHFKFQMAEGYAILPSAKIKSMIDSGKGTRLLKKIRRNYFSDELVELWNLLYDFFERAEMVGSGKSYQEKLLVSNFNLIFEDMIDQLISDKDVPTELKEQKDGKIVDHLYKAPSIVEPDKLLYHIGDSKYYKETTEVGENSIYKQFTYAKNVIQHNINLFNKEKLPDNFRYRDDLTEGYNITPNFFIRGVIDFDNPKKQDDCEPKKDSTFEECNTHFYNRLFDRDTLFLLSYDINFMSVVAAYVRNSDDVALKKSIQAMFRRDFIQFIEKKFDFYVLKPRNNDLDEAVERNFKKLVGKIYRPEGCDALVLALEIPETIEDAIEREKVKVENASVVELIPKEFYSKKYKLGDNVEPYIAEKQEKIDTAPYPQYEEELHMAADSQKPYGKGNQMELDL